MDIKELENYRLSDAVKFHKTLNPRIWGRDEHLLPEVREKLLAIAEDFKEFLGLDLEVKDITISGSNAAYTYSDHSDIDLHLVADIPRADASEVYRELFDAKKYQYNDQHDFKIGRYDVELYVQNANEQPKSQGIYSVINNEWISVPKRRKPNIDDISVRSKYEDMGRRIDAAIESGNTAQMDAVSKKLRSFRQAGLDTSGEFGPENLAFKVLRSNGTLDRLRAARSAAKNQAMSLTEKKRKKKMRYGSFGGVFFPGYHYYGQTDAAADGGGDGGGESVKESADSVDTQLQNFVKFCSNRLELEQIPRIQIKRDPAWSERNNSFGQYIPDADTLIVSVANRHPMDVMRTMAHELTHRMQDEKEDMPIDAGITGSDWENQANALAGVLMRDFAEQRPEYFAKEPISEASGYIPVNKKEARDPRYSMALTVDIKPGENQRQAAKMGWKTNPAGTPPTAKTNGLVEALTRKLQAVKEGLGFPLVSEQDLEEVAMSPGSLKAFAASDIGQSMMAGFEAELIFTGLGANEEEGEWEPDYSYDPRAYSLENIEDFFDSGDFAEGMTRQTKAALEQDWMEWYDQTLYDEFDAPDAVREWIQDNDWDKEDLIERALDDEYREDRVKEILAAMERRVSGTGTAADADLVEEYVGAEREVESQLDERVELAIAEQNSDYESALDEFRENWDRSESDWLRDRGWRNMSDIAYNFDVTWPHMTMTGGSSEGGFNEEAAQQLADSLSETLGVETTVSTGYHSARRDASTWIFEPDGSLEADDDANMPVEIVSPPMPLGEALEILPKFFAWAKDNGAYANDSTGFHMSVSMPDHGENVLDYTKLALFLGDEYVLKQFGREANTYAKSAISKIRDSMGKLNEATETRAEAVLSAMRNHLNQYASRAIAQPSGFGKYTSINPKTNYIEFRSAGGSDYFADMDKIQNTLMRYARATDIAMDPAAEKAEYAKKLYKLLTQTQTQQVTDPKTGRTRTEVKGKNDNDAISIFSRYVAGDLPKSELKGFLKQLQYGREVAKNPPKEKIQWRVTHPNRRATITLMASSAEEAIKLAKQEYNDTMNPDDAYRAEPVAPATQTPSTDQLNAPVPDDPRGNFVLRRREGNEGVGPVLYRFSAGTTGDAINAARRWTEARGMERRSVYLDSIASLSPEELQPAAATSIPDVGIDVAQNFREPPIETEPQNFPAAQQTGGEFRGRWKIVSAATGEVLHTFGGIGNVQSDANRVAAQWARQTGFDDSIEVYPMMEPQ
jgi:Zn-dependent peptidase ImmA (M78 family)